LPATVHHQGPQKRQRQLWKKRVLHEAYCISR
jgi:hypothetical protein